MSKCGDGCDCTCEAANPPVHNIDKWCPDCSRLVGVGCACNITLAEKLKSLRIDKTSLKNMGE